MNKRLPILFLVTTMVLGFLPRAVAADRWETLRAINLVENPTNQTRVGPRGELGPYQFRASTWRMHTRKPFSMATDRAAADEVAVSHYEWIKRGLVEAGIDPNPHNIAMVWNCGLSAVVDGRVPTESYRYADQVSNLVEVIQKRDQAEAAAAAAPARPAAPPSEFQVTFSDDPTVPHFVLLTDPTLPRLVVSVDTPRPPSPLTALSAAPARPMFALALAD